MAVDLGRTECRACGAKSLQPYVSKNGFDVLRCSDCGFGQVPVTQADLDRLYEESYWSGGTTANFGQVAGQQITPTYIYWIKQQLRLLAGQPAPLRVLEIGPGIGGMLADYLRREHPEVAYEAIEISEMAAAHLTAEGFKVHLGGVTSAEIVAACAGRFDLVLGMEVIEHDPDPRGFARAVHAMLRPGGWCAFTTGNLDGWIARWKKEEWYYIDPPVHVSYYTPGVFRALYAQEGFDRTTVQRYGFNYISLKLRSKIPGILVLTDLSGIATGMIICARRA